MRKEGYYWARHKHMDRSEVVQIINSFTKHTQAVWRNSLEDKFYESDFDWIDDEPIPEKKMPVKLIDSCYYVIKKICPGVDNPFVARYDDCGVFRGNAETHFPDNIKVISGPFHIDQLMSLKPS